MRRALVRLLLALTVVVLPLGAPLVEAPLVAPASAAASENPIPLLAYYYIWYNASSWNRAKTDYPLLGRYSSDEANFMQDHVRWAKDSGIDGFIVSWKSTPLLNRRLAKLVQVAGDQDFKLAIIYQGLDFFRQPLPLARVRRDLGDFVAKFASDPAFDIFGEPLVIWSGTWEFSRRQIASVTKDYGAQLTILGSEKGAEEYERIADLVEGDAYYWSSVNPDTYPAYPQKLASMGRLVHKEGGLWIAPAAPGFDARMVGGTTVVPRKEGETLRVQMRTALGSNPDAVGLISWNEFSENTHVEPSHNYGDKYLRVLADIRNLPAPEIPDFDSSEQGEFRGGPAQLAPLIGLMLVTLASMVAIARRRSRSAQASEPPEPPAPPARPTPSRPEARRSS